MGDDDSNSVEAISKCLQSQAQSDRLRVTLHAHQEMVEEDIGLLDVIRVLENATVVENYPEHKRGPCCLVTGKDDSGRDIHVVCTTSLDMAIIITVYKPKPPKWTTPYKKREQKMKCNINGCPGHYERQSIVHTVKRGDDVIVFEGVPADVCDVCSDTLLAPETVRHLEELMARHEKPRKHAPVYEYT